MKNIKFTMIALFLSPLFVTAVQAQTGLKVENIKNSVVFIQPRSVKLITPKTNAPLNIPKPTFSEFSRNYRVDFNGNLQSNSLFSGESIGDIFDQRIPASKRVVNGLVWLGLGILGR